MDLLSGMKTGAFIEGAFRRAQKKYNGIAGVITTEFFFLRIFEKSSSGQGGHLKTLRGSSSSPTR